MKKKKYYFILFIFFIMIISIGVSYSYFVSDNESNTQVLETGAVYVTLNGTNTINETDLVPGKHYIYKFSVTGKNTNSTDLKYEIKLNKGNDVASKKRIHNKFVGYSIKETTNGNYYMYLNQNLDNVIKNDNPIITGIIPENTNSEITKTYELLLYITDGVDTENTYLNYKLEINADFDENYNFDTFDYLLNRITNQAVLDNTSSTYVTSSSGIDFSAISSATNGQGNYILSSTKDDFYPVYYYRGDVTNNNVIFANLCWKIVRTTENGGIKLIYNGIPSNSQCTNTTGTATQIGTAAFNSQYKSPADVGYMYGTRYEVAQKTVANLAAAYVYGHDVSWDGNEYTLTDTMTSTGTWSNDYNTLDSHHYTCFNDKTTCNTIYYIYYTSEFDGAYFITLNDGKKVEDALKEMQMNTNDSTIKTFIDGWYESHLSSFFVSLEDAIYCNDRTINTLGNNQQYINNGWISDGGNNSNYLYYSASGRSQLTHTPSLTCHKNDAFTVKETASGNGSLKYPIGLLTVDEAMLAGGNGESDNTNYYLYTNQPWWLLSAGNFYNSTAIESYFYVSGSLLSGREVFITMGVRPVITILPSSYFITFGQTGNNGSPETPYIISITA